MKDTKFAHQVKLTRAKSQSRRITFDEFHCGNPFGMSYFSELSNWLNTDYPRAWSAFFDETEYPGYAGPHIENRMDSKWSSVAKRN
jgi:hypothetical protein